MFHRHLLGHLLAWLLLLSAVPAVPLGAQQAATPLTVQNTAAPAKLNFLQSGGWIGFWQRYEPANIAPPDLRNPAALSQAAAGGTLYLSLRQVLKLALTADLDIADAEYTQLLAQPDYLRTLAGGSARGVAGESISNALFSGAIGASTAAGTGATRTGAGSVSGGGAGVFGGGGGYDPSFNFTFTDEHTREPLDSSVLYGTQLEVLNQDYGSGSFGQNFTTGTGYSISAGSYRDFQNTDELFLNPELISDASIGVQQQFFNGGSRAANRATIVIGQNSLLYAAAVYKAQVTNIVAQAATQYWALAAAVGAADIARQAEQNAQQTLDDTNTLIQQGKVAVSNRYTAQANLIAAHQATLAAETVSEIAESKLKLFLAKQWSANVVAARIVPTDPLPIPLTAAQPPLDAMVQRAVAFSPVLAEDRVDISNNDLTVLVRKNTLLPSLTVFADYASSGVSGLGVQCKVSTFPCPSGDLEAPLPGGFGTSLGKVFTYEAPDYGIGFSLSVPVWNRANRADEATAELQAAQSRVDLQKDQNTVSEQVNEDRINLEGQAAQLQAAQQGAALEAQALSDAQANYRLGKGTITDVLTAQTSLTTAQQSEATAQQGYALDEINLAKDSGTLLDEYHIALGPTPTPASLGQLK